MYGLLPIPNYTRPVGAVSAPGTTSLFSLPNGPEGLLYKDISSIEEAVAHGGLMIFRPSDGEFIFYAGDTLKQALAHDLLGKAVIRKDPRTDVWTDTVYKSKANWTHWLYPSPGGTTDDATRWLYRAALGFKRHSEYYDHFAANADVRMFAIVTGATRGHGVKTGYAWQLPQGKGYTRTAAPGYSFMATDTPMNRSFGTLLTAKKDPILETRPTEIRNYYAGTFDAAVATVGAARPTISAITTWVGAALCATPTVVPTTWFGNFDLNTAYWVSDGYGKTPSFLSGKTLIALKTSLEWEKRGPAFNSPTGYPAVAHSDSRPTSSPGDGSAAVLYPYTSVSFDRTLGLYLADTPVLPAMSADRFDEVTFTRLPGYGVLEGYQLGAYRDAQLLKRSLVDQLLFANEIDMYGTLMEYVHSSIVGNVDATPIDTTTIDEAAATAELNALLTTSQNLYNSDAFGCGTFAIEMDGFIRHWDQLTRAAL